MTQMIQHNAKAERYVSVYAELMRDVRGQGLLARRYAYYWTQISVWLGAFVGVWVGFFVVGNSWWQLLLAALLGLVVTQFGFLGHDAAHRQIFASAA